MEGCLVLSCILCRKSQEVSGQGGNVGVRVWGKLRVISLIKTAFRSAAVGIRAGGKTQEGG